MTRHRALVAALVVMTAALTAACGGDDGSGNSGGTASPADTPAGGTTPRSTATVGPEDTPTEFETLRDELSAQLDAIGVNIGAVPDDIRDQILASCRELATFADGKRVEEMCEAIERAMENDDPGLIDLVVDQLAELEPD